MLIPVEYYTAKRSTYLASHLQLYFSNPNIGHETIVALLRNSILKTSFNNLNFFDDHHQFLPKWKIFVCLLNHHVIRRNNFPLLFLITDRDRLGGGKIFHSFFWKSQSDIGNKYCDRTRTA